MQKLPFGFDKPQDSPGFLLWQTTLTWQRLIKNELDKHNISHIQFVIMAVLLWLKTNNQSTNQIYIAQLNKLDKMTVSKALKKLALIGLVTRIEDPIDTRSKNAQLTAKGVELINVLVPIVEKTDTKFFGKLVKSSQMNLNHILSVLVNTPNK